MRFPSSFSDRGTVTAELAMGIPAILGLVGIVLGGMRWGMDAVTATTVAAETSLGIARGEQDNVALDRARALLPSAEWSLVKSASSTGRKCARHAANCSASPCLPPRVRGRLISGMWG